VAPHGPRTHSADQLTQGLHCSLARNGCRITRPPPSGWFPASCEQVVCA
jgi:hypothetical protein